MDNSRSMFSVWVGWTAAVMMDNFFPHAGIFAILAFSIAGFAVAGVVEHYRSRLQNEGEITWKVGGRG